MTTISSARNCGVRFNSTALLNPKRYSVPIRMNLACLHSGKGKAFRSPCLARTELTARGTEIGTPRYFGSQESVPSTALCIVPLASSIVHFSTPSTFAIASDDPPACRALDGRAAMADHGSTSPWRPTRPTINDLLNPISPPSPKTFEAGHAQKGQQLPGFSSIDPDQRLASPSNYRRASHSSQVSPTPERDGIWYREQGPPFHLKPAKWEGVHDKYGSVRSAYTAHPDYGAEHRRGKFLRSLSTLPPLPFSWVL